MKIKDVVTLVTQSISPETDTKYHLYSLPSYDENQTREEVFGSEIQSNKYLVPNRCILFNKLNVRFKRIWAIDNQDENKLCSTEFLPLVVDESKVDFKYCLYLLQSESITDYLCGQNANTSGSHKRIDPHVFLGISIHLPQLEEQKRIGHLLASIDAKIRLNRAINQNLEALAKQLYDYWFVQFDFPNEEGKPYKSSGGKMVWNETLKMELPLGWNNSTLETICNLYQPQTIGTDMLQSNGKFRVYGANGLVGWYNKYNHENSEIAMACRGNSCGTLNRTIPYSWITGNAMVVQLKNQSICNEYIKQALGYMNITGVITGSGQPQLTRENLKIVPCVSPSDTVLIAYSQKVAPIVNYQIQIIEEIDELTSQRNELLPLLMNGQVTIK